MDKNNPLLGNNGLPHFDRIKSEHVIPAVDSMLADCEKDLKAIEANPGKDWDSIVPRLESIRRRMHTTWSPVQHLIGVKNSPELRDAYQTALPKIVSFSLRFSQSKPVYMAFKNLREGSNWQKLTPGQQRVVHHVLQQAKLSGIELEGKAQERFNDVSQKVSQLQTTFSNNVLDSTKEYELVVKDKKTMDGVPENFLGMWAETYNERHPGSTATAADGPWAVTLSFPSYMPFMKYCKDRKLREQIYRVYVTRASSGKFDNHENIYEILRLRRESSRLLGFHSFAEVSLASKMAGDVASVERLLHDLSGASTAKAHEELNELREFAKRDGLNETMMNWDVNYYLEKMRQKKFDFSDDELRPYFPLPHVLKGLFSLLNRLFGISVVESKETLSKWHPDVLYYDVLGEKGEKIAGFYLDPYSRPSEKRGGAWMDTCLDRGKVDGKQIHPVAYLVCNGTPPVGNTPSLLSFEEVETLFHEFGHGLQHMLTQVDQLDVAGINGIEWDAVELPSQFMENWCYQRSVIKNLTRHIQSGASLPDELFDKIYQAKTFNAANFMVRQLHFSLTDLELHHRFDPDSGQKIEDVSRAISKRVCAMQPVPEDRALCTFEHIFAGGYAAGYYSYKWAEVLSADAFERFEEEGLDDSNVARVGREFRNTVLALGGSIHPMEVFTKFRGRAPEVKALLRHNGLNVQA